MCPAPGARRPTRAASRRRGEAGRPRCHGSGRARSVRGDDPRRRAPPAPATIAATRPAAASGRPASRFARAAASTRCERRRGSGVSSAARARNAAAAASRRVPAPVRRPLELGRDVLVRRECGVCAMPRTAVGIDRRIDRVRQRAVRGAPLGRRRAAVDRRAKERVPEDDARAEVDQPSASAGAAASAVSPSAAAARHSSVGSPTGSAAATTSNACVSGGSAPTRRR